MTYPVPAVVAWTPVYSPGQPLSFSPSDLVTALAALPPVLGTVIGYACSKDDPIRGGRMGLVLGLAVDAVVAALAWSSPPWEPPLGLCPARPRR